jgi:hypothetical protein
MAYFMKPMRRRGLPGLFGDDGGDESVSASSPIVSGGFIGPLLPTSAPDTTIDYSAKADAAIAAAKAARAGQPEPVYSLPAAQAQPAAQASPWSTFAANVIGAAAARITTKPQSGIVKTPPPVSSTTSMLLPVALVGIAAFFLLPALMRKRA